MVTIYRETKTALSRSGIIKDGWCINPYGGCVHCCRYCYATFMRRFNDVREPWGEYVIVKKNILDVLDRELLRRRPARVWMASVTDAWQPVERRLKLARGAMERLLCAGFELSLLTKSPLIVRDIDLMKKHPALVDAGVTVTTDDPEVARFMEPRVQPPLARIETLAKLSDAGITTHAFVGPALPMNPQKLASALKAVTGRVIIDRMNYTHKVSDAYASRGWNRYLGDPYYAEVVAAFRAEFGPEKVMAV
ncbi:MAG: radical SAM protein [Myxococcota bacterium]|jgi:DNA repair photolyase